MYLTWSTDRGLESQIPRATIEGHNGTAPRHSSRKDREDVGPVNDLRSPIAVCDTTETATAFSYCAESIGTMSIRTMLRQRHLSTWCRKKIIPRAGAQK